MIRQRTTGSMRGFTIVELMMATLVFSLILLLVTIGVLQVNRVYYKGVTEANTQNVARGIMDTIAQAIQFDGGTVTPLPTNSAPVAGSQYYVCVNNQQFVYRPGYQLVTGSPGTHQTTQSLIQRTISGSCAAPGGPVTGRELLSPNMRLSNLQISQIGTTNLYKVQVSVTYGDDTVMNNPITAAPTCLGIRAGNQFCSTTSLSTVIEKRIN
ncbi:MAG TPA: prepilin-type N-terminal cleavage/methylation domain-containing protein [Candidatus Saccharimonadales bacterium]